jgi:hypothetical protein
VLTGAANADEVQLLSHVFRNVGPRHWSRRSGYM